MSIKIPEAPYYVTATDTFLSGWGPATGKISVVILPCKNYDEAERVERYANSRSDMKRVQICQCKPRTRSGVLYKVMDRKHARAWYGAE